MRKDWKLDVLDDVSKKVEPTKMVKGKEKTVNEICSESYTKLVEFSVAKQLSKAEIKSETILLISKLRNVKELKEKLEVIDFIKDRFKNSNNEIILDISKMASMCQSSDELVNSFFDFLINSINKDKENYVISLNLLKTLSDYNIKEVKKLIK